MGDVEIKKYKDPMPYILHNVSLIIEDNYNKEYVFKGFHNMEEITIKIPIEQVEYVKREV